MTNILIAGTILAFVAPWLFLLIYMRDIKQFVHLWRETLVYLKSASAYEAEDALDRVSRRNKPLIERVLEKKKKEDENLSEDSIDMAEEIRKDLHKNYDTGTGK